MQTWTACLSLSISSWRIHGTLSASIDVNYERPFEDPYRQPRGYGAALRRSLASRRARGGDRRNKYHIPRSGNLLAALTPKRLHLLHYVRRHQVRNVRALATGLGRNYKNVHKDVEELTKLGLLSRTPDQVVAPYAEVNAGFVL